MPRRIVLSLAVAIAALLLGLVLAFLSRGSTPQPQPEPQPQEEPISPTNRRSRKAPRATFCVIMKAGWPSSGRRATPRR